MARDFTTVFATLKPVLAKHANELSVKTDASLEYKLVGTCASWLPQHKGQPLKFGSVVVGKAYVSFHLMPLYELAKNISPELSKRMQGKTCFNFKNPEPDLLTEPKQLTAEALELRSRRKWL